MDSDSETSSVVPVSSNDVLRTPSVMDIPDLVNLIADYCEDESISKLSRVS